MPEHKDFTSPSDFSSQQENLAPGADEMVEAPETVREPKPGQVDICCFPEVKCRLTELGWTNEDLNFGPWSNKQWQFDWVWLVCQPGPLSNEDWENTWLKLIVLLKKNRTARLKQERKAARQIRLSEHLNTIKKRVSPPLQFTISHPSSSVWDHASPCSYWPLFPAFTQLSQWSVINNLLETDCNVEEMDARLNDHLHFIEAWIIQWIREVTLYYATLVRSEGTLRISGAIVEPTMLELGDTSSTLSNYSNSHKLLLRADSLFYDTAWTESFPAPLTFSAIIHQSGLSSSKSLMFDSQSLQKPFHLDRYKFHQKAHEVAAALLISMNIPNASYLPLISLGAEFQCERCYCTQRMTWQELILHYITSSRLFKAKVGEMNSSSRRVTYIDLHDPAVRINRPMVKYCSISPREELGVSTVGHYNCQLCAEIQIPHTSNIAEWAVIRHVQDVHGVAKPVCNQHYSGRQFWDYSNMPGWNGYGMPPYDPPFF